MEENKDTVTINFDISGIKQQIEFVEIKKAQLSDLYAVVEVNRSRMRELEKGPLDNPELKKVMAEFWNNSLALDLSLSTFLELSDWIHSEGCFEDNIKKYKSLKSKK